ncbi:heat shock protein DnaJ, partial [Cryphonectria parasitica EP155]
MATPSTLDPYKTLGVEAGADAAAIKKAYRKLVLTCHPDKVTDESLREEKQEEFHRIQQAYETIGEPDKREQYD